MFEIINELAVLSQSPINASCAHYLRGPRGHAPNMRKAGLLQPITKPIDTGVLRNIYMKTYFTMKG